jgi:hypothetical protein
MRPQKIKLNLTPGGIPPVVHASQYDVGRSLEFELYDGITKYEIPEDTVAIIQSTKPDGNGFAYNCTWSGSTVSIDTTQQMTAVSGSMDCEIRLILGTDVIGSINFILEIEPAALRSDTPISETEIPALEDLGRHYAEEAANSAEAAADSAAAAADSADDASDYADDARNSWRQAKSWATYSINPNDWGSDSDNAEYWSDQARAAYENIVVITRDAINRINALSALIDLFLSDVYLTTEDGDQLITEDGDHLIINY